MRILVNIRLLPRKNRDHLMPLLLRDDVTHMTIVRYDHVPHLADHPKITQHIYGQRGAGRYEARVRPWQRVWYVLRHGPASLRAARQTQPDVVYAVFMVPYGLITWITARLTGRPSMITLIGTDFNKDVQVRAWAPFWRWMLRRVDVITIYSAAARARLIELGIPAERVFVVPHAIDMGAFIRRPDAPQDFDAIFLGGLIPLKEVARLLATWALVCQTHPTARLALVGDGPLRAALETQAARLGIADTVHFAGWSDDPPAWMSRARLFINLSSQEGVPIAMLEAMACGLVPIVTDVGSVGAVVQSGENGYLVPHPAPPKHVAAIITRLLDDPTQWAALREAAATVRDQYSYEAVAQHWTPVLERLAARGVGSESHQKTKQGP
ncbi:MAG: glycosyltransferase [Anaerolineales bacterium]